MALDTFNPYLFVSAGEQSNKFLTPVISPDGIAAFQAQRAQDLTGLTVRIDQIQSGSGDPSPTNIRPISGRTGMTVTRSGKNLCSGFNNYGQNNRVTPIMRLSGGIAYTFSCNSMMRAGGIYVRKGSTISLDDDIAPIIKTVYDATTVTFTPTETGDYFIQLYKFGDGWTTEPTNAQVEVGSTATEYAPYVALTTYPITWETEAGTVYGGTLDVVSGELTVDRAIITLDGSQAIGMSQSNRGYIQIADAIQIDISNQTIDKSVVCDRLKSTTWGYLGYSGYSLYCAPLFGHGVAFRDDTKTTAADWTAYFTENPTQFSYKLATPQTYQLTPTQVRTISGYNQVYSDAGPVIDIKF